MKKQKDYPDECPIVQWTRGSEPRLLLGTDGSKILTSMSSGGHGRVPFDRVDELIPLTPAAEDLLAAIREELGQWAEGATP